MFLFQLINVLLISITFYTYLSSVVFSCDLAFRLSSIWISLEKYASWQVAFIFVNDKCVKYLSVICCLFGTFVHFA